MKNCHALQNQTAPRILLIACAAALAVAFTLSLPQPAHADDVTPPPVPSNIQVPAGNKAFLEGHADGTQNYNCLPCPNPTTTMCPDASGFAWILFGPQATLFDDDDEHVITHFLSPNPSPNDPLGSGTPRATWQHSQDTSTVWAMAIASYSTPGFNARGDIPWLLLQVVGAQDGPTSGHTLTVTTFIQRLNTSGGVAPSTGCASAADVGKRAFVPYTADYFFYKAGN
jgi:hypothetical protein